MDRRQELLGQGRRLDDGGTYVRLDEHFIPRLVLALTLLGAVPFVGMSAGIALFHLNSQGMLQSLFTYAAVILAFLGGIHWGIAVTHVHALKPEVARFMYVESMLCVGLAWGILFIDAPYLRLLAFAFLYALAWGIDSVLFGMRLIPLWYFNLRGIVTPIVVVSIYVAYFSII